MKFNQRVALPDPPRPIAIIGAGGIIRDAHLPAYRTIKHPKMPDLAQTRSSIILDYSDHVQARVITNHGHKYGLVKQQSYLKIEGAKGAINIHIGLSMDYPWGVPPKFEYTLLSEEPPPGKRWRWSGGGSRMRLLARWPVYSSTCKTGAFRCRTARKMHWIRCGSWKRLIYQAKPEAFPFRKRNKSF